MTEEQEKRRRELQNLDDQIVTAIRAVQTAQAESLKVYGSLAGVSMFLSSANDVLLKARTLHQMGGKT